MVANIKPIIYGNKKNIDFKKYNDGSLLNAISYDMKEFGERGVQGLAVKMPDAQRMIKYEKANKNRKDPYLMAGVCQKDLVLVVRDKTDAKFEAMTVLVKGYVGIKDKLAKQTASVTNIAPGRDKIIEDSVKDTAAKLKTKVSKDPNYGEITGNIVLTAHGRPAVMPSGRVVGDQLGRKNPKQIVALLTGSKDPKKRVGSDYNGTITLCGCFTASGGPEGEKKDDPFAKKVLDLLRKKGFKKLSVVGYPGATITVSKGGTDSKGTQVRRGDEKVLASQPTGADMRKARMLEDTLTKLLKKRNDLVNDYNTALEGRDAARRVLREALDNFQGSQQDYAKDPEGKKKFKAYADAKKEFKKTEGKFEKADSAYEKAKKAADKTGLEDTYARLEGRFGLRQIN